MADSAPVLASIDNPGMPQGLMPHAKDDPHPHGYDASAPPPRAPDSQPSDDQPAVEPGQRPSPAQQAKPPPPPPVKQPVITWAEVTAKPMYRALPPEQKEAARNAYWNENIAPKIRPEDLKVAKQAFDKDTLPKDGPQASGGTVGAVLDHALGAAFGPVEAAAHVASQAIALPVEAAGSLLNLATAPAGHRVEKAAGLSQAIGEAMTYQPKTSEGANLASKADWVGGLVPKVANWATKDIAEDPTIKKVLGPAGSAAAQGVANATLQALPTAAGLRAGKTAVTEASSAAAAARATAATARASEGLTRAKAYVAKETGLDWDKLPPRMQNKLSKIAESDPDALFKMKPGEIERQVRLEKLGIPATRGQVARDVEQLTREENMSKKAGPVQEINTAQDEALHRQLDVVRRSTGAKATTRQQVGKTVQNDALRNKAAVSTRNYDRAYKEARATEPNATVKADPFYEFLEKNGEVLNPEVQHLGFLKTWLNKAKLERPAEAQISTSTDVTKALKDRGKPASEEIVRRPIKLVELDDMRKKASSIAKKGGEGAHYAGELVKAIDKAFESIPAAATKWKEAREAFKAHKLEFEDQSLVKKLTSNKGKSRTDRATALEDTTDTILKASAEDITKLEKTLKEGGNAQTQAAGKRAWSNIQAGVIEDLRAAAAGRRRIPGDKGGAAFNSPFRDIFGELDADGKIDVLFSKAQAKRLRQIHEAVADVRTKPAGRIAGSDTAARLALSRAESASLIPGVGKGIALAGKLGGKAYDMTAAARQGAKAKTSRLDEAATKAAKKIKSAGRSGNTLRSIKAGAGVAHRATLKDRDQKKKADRE